MTEKVEDKEDKRKVRKEIFQNHYLVKTHRSYKHVLAYKYISNTYSLTHTIPFKLMFRSFISVFLGFLYILDN